MRIFRKSYRNHLRAGVTGLENSEMNFISSSEKPRLNPTGKTAGFFPAGMVSP